jgi:hypothetical protein
MNIARLLGATPKRDLWCLAIVGVGVVGSAVMREVWPFEITAIVCLVLHGRLSLTKETRVLLALLCFGVLIASNWTSYCAGFEAGYARFADVDDKTPNQPLERNDPSRHAGCCAPVAPAGVVAHL